MFRAHRAMAHALEESISTFQLVTPELTDRIKSVVSLEIFHEQLPLPVPCYDLPPVIEFAVGPHEARFWAPPTPLG